MFDVFYIGENENLKSHLPLARKISDANEAVSNTKMYWLVEENVEVTDYTVFEYRPPEHDAKYQHVWKWAEKKYGGIHLYPSRRQPTGVKEIDRVVCKRKFDIFYVGENPRMAHNVPSAVQVKTLSECAEQAGTNMYWVVEPNIDIVDFTVFDFRPEQWDQIYTHEFKWNTANYGGIKLIPRVNDSGEVKQVNRVVCKKRFDILRDVKPGQYFKSNPLATHVWCVDPEYKIDHSIDWAPSNFEPDFIHSFHLRGQLEHKYPAKEGGVKLFPRNWREADVKFHKFLDAAARYPVKRVLDVNDNSQRDEYTDEYVWLIDEAYQINEETLDWVPNPFEQDFIHQFRMPYQLRDKYPGREGGIRLVPRDYESAIQRIHNGTVVHLDCPITDVQYDVFYINDELDEELIQEFADRSKTDWFWLVDKDYDINGELRFVPQRGETDYNHVFNIPGMVEDKYSSELANSAFEHDPLTIGGIWLLNKQFDLTKWKYQEGVIPVRYDIFYTDNIDADLEQYARKSTTKMFWLVESEVSITDDINWLPPLEYQRSINEFEFGDTGIRTRLVPVKYEHAQIIQHDKLRNLFEASYEIFSSEEEGRANCKNDWFWVVDPDVDVVDDFDWDFQPEKWDGSFLNEGKTHVWQKINPKTSKQYDYGGVMLCPKKPQAKGRPKYIMEPGCVQKEYPLFHISPEHDTIIQLENFDAQCETGMFWVVDAFTVIDEDFNFDYYPTQWDVNKIHVFADEDGIYRNVRLYPKGTFAPGHSYNQADVAYNRFTPVQDVKRMSATASLRPGWPVLDFIDFTVDELTTTLNTYHKRGIPYVWTVDPDVEVNRQTLHEKFNPQSLDEEAKSVIPDFDEASPEKVHVWQRVNHKGKVINNSGLRLWPTDYDATHLTDKKLRLNEIDDQVYVDKPGCSQPDFHVYYLKPEDNVIEQLEKFDQQSYTSMYWVVDPFTRIDGDWEFDSFVPTKYDEGYVHVFKSEDGDYRNIRLYPRNTFKGVHGYTVDKITNNSFENLKKVDIVASSVPTYPVIDLGPINKDQFLEQMSEMALTHGFVWTKDGDVDAHEDVITSGFLPAMSNAHKVHVWQRMNPHSNKTHSYGGLRLWPTTGDYSELTTDELFLNKIRNLQYVRKPGCTYKPYEIVFLSYHEPYAEDAYKRLSRRFDVHWVKDIEGIFTAHQEAAKKVSSSMFWVVDADADIDEDFDFSYMPDVYDQNVVHVWNSKNPITGMEYGYGGVKLFNTQQVLDANSWGLDFTTGLSSRFKAMPEVSCITRFNTDAYSTWRSAFRECVKLTMNGDDESKKRLEGWLHPVPDADFRHEAKAGAEEGVAYAKQFANKPLKIAKINDYEWLQEQYENRA